MVLSTVAREARAQPQNLSQDGGRSLRILLRMVGIVPEEFENLNLMLLLSHFNLQVLDADKVVLPLQHWGPPGCLPGGSESLRR